MGPWTTNNLADPHASISHSPKTAIWPRIIFSWRPMVPCGRLSWLPVSQRWSPRGHGLGLEASSRVLGLGLGLGSQVLGLGLEPKVLGLGPETGLALLVFKQILCKVLRCSSASVNEHTMYQL